MKLIAKYEIEARKEGREDRDGTVKVSQVFPEDADKRPRLDAVDHLAEGLLQTILHLQDRHPGKYTEHTSLWLDTESDGMQWADVTLLVLDAPPNPRDWPEDAAHENGNYNNTCSCCLDTFIGHKRRVVCKACYTRDTQKT